VFCLGFASQSSGIIANNPLHNVYVQYNLACFDVCRSASCSARCKLCVRNGIDSRRWTGELKTWPQTWRASHIYPACTGLAPGSWTDGALASALVGPRAEGSLWSGRQASRQAPAGQDQRPRGPQLGGEEGEEGEEEEEEEEEEEGGVIRWAPVPYGQRTQSHCGLSCQGWRAHSLTSVLR